MDLVDFHPDHLRGLDPLERNGVAKLQGIARTTEGQSAFTLLHAGRPTACGGLIPIHQGRAFAWSVITLDTPLVPAARLARRYLDLQDMLRIETVVDCEDEPSQRWLKFIGFERETPPLVGYNADGGSAFMYVRLNHGNGR
ncbi:MAG: hypothetical protein ACPGVG_17010 [Mycobacterium sp.]